MLNISQADDDGACIGGGKPQPPAQQHTNADPKKDPLFEQASKLLVDKQGSMKQSDISRCSAGIADGKCQAVIDYLKGL
jgi:hypothetical protein